MIQNLNKLSFQRYGIILPEIPAAGDPEYTCASLVCDHHSSQVHKTLSDTFLTCQEGMAVLSVALDGEHFEDFYMDKSVQIKPDVYYSIRAFQNRTVLELTSKTLPDQVGHRPDQKELQLQRRLTIDKLYTFFYQEKEKGFLFSGESHPVLELTYVDQGSLHSVADGQDLLLEQGELVVYGPDQWHMQYADIHVAPRFLTVAFEAEGYDLISLYNRKFRPGQKAVALLQQMLQEQERMDEFSPDMILGQLTLVLLSLLRKSDSPEARLQSAHCVSNENDIIRRAQQYISNNVRSRLTVPLVAKNTDVSASYLTALFHKHLQLSPGEYIRRIKLQESKQMIREGSMNFTEIAEALQYSNIHHFSRQFKEKFGITPTQYAKSIK